ncbi:MAG: hypothetical protein CMH57_06840 [Myxococcales bacterium]|nr:hypothetical protein [Myxococcales bacterium]
MAQDTTTTARPDLSVEINQEQHDKILLLLSGYEYFPTYDELVAVTPDAHVALFRIALDDSMKPSHRVRAIDALGLFPEDDALAGFLEEALTRTDLKPTFTRHYINTALKVYQEQAVSWVAPHLNNPDLQTQLTVIHSLGLFGGESGAELLEFHRQFMPRDVLVERTLENAIDRARR